MTEYEALKVAIEALDRECLRLAPIARDWQQYGDKLRFNRSESKQAAETYVRCETAIDVLQRLREKIGQVS